LTSIEDDLFDLFDLIESLRSGLSGLSLLATRDSFYMLYNDLIEFYFFISSAYTDDSDESS
jgi:hypothetical protein